MLSICKETQKLALWFDIFLKKACMVFKKALPLHPLSGTKFSAGKRKEFIERFTQTVVVQEQMRLSFLRRARLGRTLRTVGSLRSLVIKIKDVGNQYR